MSLKTATEQIQSAGRVVSLEQENALLKAALLESKQAYTEQAKNMNEQIKALNNRLETLCKAVDASNAVAGQNIQMALQNGCNGALRAVTDQSGQLMANIEKYNKQVMAATQRVTWHVMVTDRGVLLCWVLCLIVGAFGVYNVCWGQEPMLKIINNGVWQLLQR